MAQPTNNPTLPSHPLFVSESTLAEREFPLLTALLENPTVNKVLADDSILEKLTKQRWADVATANHECGKDLGCKSRLLRFAPDQIEQISSELDRVYLQSAVVRSFVHAHLALKDLYTLDHSTPEQQIFVGSWKRSALAMNQIIATYCDGVAPHYSKIDNMLYNPDDSSFTEFVSIVIDGLHLENSGSYESPRRWPASETLFFEPTLRFSLRLLEANMRDEAGRFWPLETSENKTALLQKSMIHWKEFRYSVILVPGAGPETYETSLSPLGKERLRLAVAAYRAGMAPYILLSGGFVHPSHTPFCEAMEMKKYLEEVYGIPAIAILVDPQARHTTTNLRNGARQIFDYHLPADRPMLLVSDRLQTDYMAGEVFQKRNLDELGYMPVKIGKRLSDFELEATPLHQSEFRDAMDPLDP